jgi:hypothetical protein
MEIATKRHPNEINRYDFHDAFILFILFTSPLIGSIYKINKKLQKKEHQELDCSKNIIGNKKQ